MTDARNAGRVAIALIAGVLAAVAGWVLFVDVPDSTHALLGIVLVLVAVGGGLRIGRNVASTLLPGYNVAEVAVEGPIRRDSGGFTPGARTTPDADDVVELIEQADEDGTARALLLRLNTPGGAVVPSDDIRLAAERFDGPTIAYATDVCASGGYWIASGCDELWTREGTVVGSIGVRGSLLTIPGLLEEHGVEYESLTAGEYKDAGTPFSELSEDERGYLQGIVDEYYEQFLETVAEGREMDPEALRETEARVYLGDAAHEMGLVDAIGTREDVEDRLEDQLGTEVETTELKPTIHIAERLRAGAERVAYAAGAGVASRFADEDLKFRV